MPLRPKEFVYIASQPIPCKEFSSIVHILITASVLLTFIIVLSSVTRNCISVNIKFVKILFTVYISTSESRLSDVGITTGSCRNCKNQNELVLCMITDTIKCYTAMCVLHMQIPRRTRMISN